MRSKLLLILVPVILLLFLFTGIYVIFCGRLPFSDFVSKNPAGELIEEAKTKNMPLAFFVYTSSKDKKAWNEIVNDTQLKDQLNRFITKVVPVKYIKNQFPEYYSKNPSTSLMICDHKGKKISYNKGISDKESISVALSNALDYHKKLMIELACAKKEFFKVKSIYDSKKYILAMEQIRNYLYIYKNTDYGQEARELLNSASQTPQVLDYIKQNRDMTNLKALVYQAKECFEYKRYYALERIVAAIQQTNPGTDEAKEVQKLKEEMEKIGREKYKEANDLYNKKYFMEAIEAFESLRTRFKGTHWDLFISGRIQQIQNDPEYKHYMDDLQSNKEAKNIIKRADEAFNTKNFAMAEQYYFSVIKFYAKSPYVDRAKQRINDINRLRNQPAEEPANN